MNGMVINFQNVHGFCLYNRMIVYKVLYALVFRH